MSHEQFEDESQRFNREKRGKVGERTAGVVFSAPEKTGGKQAQGESRSIERTLKGLFRGTDTAVGCF